MRTNRDEGILLRGASLVEAERWLKERSDDLSEDEKIFLNESISLREQEQKLKEEAHRREMEHIKELKVLTQKAEDERDRA